MNFLDKLKSKWKKRKFVCVGLDQANFEINKSIINKTAKIVCAYKPNSAFYEARGIEGLQSLKNTISYIRNLDPQMPVILDAKRGDVENTNMSYVKAAFDELKADAVTVFPYLGKESLQPFLERTDKGIFVLVKTSNKGADEFQDLLVASSQKPLYQIVAEHVVDWNENGNLGVVVGATYPQELKKVREAVGDLPILIPGIGAQGGNLAAILKAGLDSKGEGIIISSSREIIFAAGPGEATVKLDQQIKELLKSV
ncbi:orotidine-5'-phosphate decarboxylase [Candidatus Daviesbacteria bacterium]|nr:orotidine-5'-phosphate decarboxylase [Candidatus Daviesbacteria bacterium]